ncbi:MAG: cytochrome C oxidase subunit IV family protein [Pleurocapsa minor GSE-CHR-MK-17-07R]|jgi:caa(3)-type oxidase subunit IV|nr:cytochrome C oxidase subunit IV family protein [Pleurocapsa minor GSE-CHR-MK 17-07R]
MADEQVLEARAEEAAASASVHLDPAMAEGNALTQGLEPEHASSPATMLAHSVPDTTVVFGRVIPANIYVVVFGALAILTIIEVILAEILPESVFFRTPLLVVMSLAKAVLVMLYYMHLKEDNKLFAAAIILPLLIGVVSCMFLLAVPSTGYGPGR